MQDGLRSSTDRGGHDGHARGKGLQDDIGQAFRVGRQREQIEVRIVLVQVGVKTGNMKTALQAAGKYLGLQRAAQRAVAEEDKSNGR